MIQKMWLPESRKTLICVDSYECGVLKGWFYNTYQEPEPFESLSQLLIKMETMLDENRMPQAYTEPRSFSSLLFPSEESLSPQRSRKGARATFELQVLFRQHTSWQGIVLWKETHQEQSFRSVLELILLMDSALRSMDISTAV